MEDHEIYWKAARLSSGSPAHCDTGALYSAPDPLGRAQVSSWVTVNTDYELSFDKMNHRFSSPSHIILENVTFGRDGKPATLVAKKWISA
jgi:hypothetical protein